MFHRFSTFLLVVWVVMSSLMTMVPQVASFLENESIKSDLKAATEQVNRGNIIYKDCGINKTCFGYPTGCVETKSCQDIATCKVKADLYEFELMASTSSSTPAFIALGLSVDKRMGDDLVSECVNEDGNVRLYSSFNRDYKNYRDGTPQNTMRLLESYFNDGVLYCKFERDAITMTNGQTFDLSKNEYFLLLAVGAFTKRNGVGYHDLSRTISSKPFSAYAQISVGKEQANTLPISTFTSDPLSETRTNLKVENEEPATITPEKTNDCDDITFTKEESSDGEETVKLKS